MKSSLLLLLLLPISFAAPRTKRFAALASGIGGAAGCVVTGNKLYANGFELRELTSAEQGEMQKYQTALVDYKNKLKSALETRRNQLKQQMMQSNGDNSVSQVTDPVESLEAPNRPSFCTEATTTQYYFDGCMVQNNKVYVGKTYARDLNDSEVQQLQEFDTKMTAYQKQVQENIHKQMKGMFGGKDFFAALFGAEVSDDTPSSTSPESTTLASSSSTNDKLEAPDAPQFCVSI